MFHLTTGTFRDIESAFLADLTKAKTADPRAQVLVLSPSGQILNRLQRHLATYQLIASLGTVPNGMINAFFLTFYALAERLLSETLYTETVVTEPALYQEMIRQVLEGDHPEPVDLAIRQALNPEGKPIPVGLAGALAATLKDLRDSGMLAKKAVEVAKEGYLGKEAPEAASTLALYARVIGLFEKKELRSSADLLRRAAKESPTNPWLKKQKAIFLYGFYDLTGVQLDLVLSLANHPDARVYFPFEEGVEAHAFAQKLLEDPAFASKCRIGDPADRRTGDKENLRSSEPPTRRTDIWSCSGSRDELWTVAKEITQLADEGILLPRNRRRLTRAWGLICRL